MQYLAAFDGEHVVTQRLRVRALGIYLFDADDVDVDEVVRLCTKADLFGIFNDMCAVHLGDAVDERLWVVA